MMLPFALGYGFVTLRAAWFILSDLHHDAIVFTMVQLLGCHVSKGNTGDHSDWLSSLLSQACPLIILKGLGHPWSNFDLDFQWAAFLAFDAEGSQAFYVGWNPFVAGPRALVFSDANSFRGGAFQVTALPSCKSISTAIDNVFGSRSAVEKGRAFAV